GRAAPPRRLGPAGPADDGPARRRPGGAGGGARGRGRGGLGRHFRDAGGDIGDVALLGWLHGLGAGGGGGGRRNEHRRRGNRGLGLLLWLGSGRDRLGGRSGSGRRRDDGLGRARRCGTDRGGRRRWLGAHLDDGRRRGRWRLEMLAERLPVGAERVGLLAAQHDAAGRRLGCRGPGGALAAEFLRHRQGLIVLQRGGVALDVVFMGL